MLVELADIDELPVFYGTEQPETCRKCGVRTEFDDIASWLQVHQCMNCANRYVVEFDESWEYGTYRVPFPSIAFRRTPFGEPFRAKKLGEPRQC